MCWVILIAGVRLAAFSNTGVSVTFASTDGGATGKYLGEVNALFIGATLKAKGTNSILRVVSAINSVTLGTEVVSGSFEDLRYPAEIELNFRPSDYWTGALIADTTAVRDLRISANDTYLSAIDPADYTQLSSWPAPALIPDDQYRFELVFNPFFIPAAGTWNTLYSMGTAAATQMVIEYGNSVDRLQVTINNVRCGQVAMPSISGDAEWTIIIQKSIEFGDSFSVNGIEGINSANTDKS